MNDFQRLWWQQACSDFDVFELLRREGVVECHLLHYLQMASEKIAKAYLWQADTAPALTHVGFMTFLKLLGQLRRSDGERIARILGYKNWDALRREIRTFSPVAHAIQNLAPALATDGPNPEYPWPHDRPTSTPCEYEFAVWRDLQDTPSGRSLMQLIEAAVRRFPEYADV